MATQSPEICADLASILIDNFKTINYEARRNSDLRTSVEEAIKFIGRPTKHLESFTSDLILRPLMLIMHFKLHGTIIPALTIFHHLLEYCPTQRVAQTAISSFSMILDKSDKNATQGYTSGNQLTDDKIHLKILQCILLSLHVDILHDALAVRSCFIVALSTCCKLAQQRGSIVQNTALAAVRQIIRFAMEAACLDLQQPVVFEAFSLSHRRQATHVTSSSSQQQQQQLQKQQPHLATGRDGPDVPSLFSQEQYESDLNIDKQLQDTLQSFSLGPSKYISTYPHHVSEQQQQQPKEVKSPSSSLSSTGSSLPPGLLSRSSLQQLQAQKEAEEAAAVAAAAAAEAAAALAPTNPEPEVSEPEEQLSIHLITPEYIATTQAEQFVTFPSLALSLTLFVELCTAARNTQGNTASGTPTGTFRLQSVVYPSISSLDPSLCLELVHDILVQNAPLFVSIPHFTRVLSTDVLTTIIEVLACDRSSHVMAGVRLANVLLLQYGSISSLIPQIELLASLLTRQLHVTDNVNVILHILELFHVLANNPRPLLVLRETYDGNNALRQLRQRQREIAAHSKRQQQQQNNSSDQQNEIISETENPAGSNGGSISPVIYMFVKALGSLTLQMIEQLHNNQIQLLQPSLRNQNISFPNHGLVSDPVMLHSTAVVNSSSSSLSSTTTSTTGSVVKDTMSSLTSSKSKTSSKSASSLLSTSSHDNNLSAPSSMRVHTHNDLTSSSQFVSYYHPDAGIFQSPLFAANASVISSQNKQTELHHNPTGTNTPLQPPSYSNAPNSNNNGLQSNFCSFVGHTSHVSNQNMPTANGLPGLTASTVIKDHTFNTSVGFFTDQSFHSLRTSIFSQSPIPPYVYGSPLHIFTICLEVLGCFSQSLLTLTQSLGQFESYEFSSYYETLQQYLPANTTIQHNSRLQQADFQPLRASSELPSSTSSLSSPSSTFLIPSPDVNFDYTNVRSFSSLLRLFIHNNQDYAAFCLLGSFITSCPLSSQQTPFHPSFFNASVKPTRAMQLASQPSDASTTLEPTTIHTQQYSDEVLQQSVGRNGFSLLDMPRTTTRGISYYVMIQTLLSSLTTAPVYVTRSSLLALVATLAPSLIATFHLAAKFVRNKQVYQLCCMGLQNIVTTTITLSTTTPTYQQCFKLRLENIFLPMLSFPSIQFSRKTVDQRQTVAGSPLTPLASEYNSPRVGINNNTLTYFPAQPTTAFLTKFLFPFMQTAVHVLCYLSLPINDYSDLLYLKTQYSLFGCPAEETLASVTGCPHYQSHRSVTLSEATSTSTLSSSKSSSSSSSSSKTNALSNRSMNPSHAVMEQDWLAQIMSPSQDISWPPSLPTILPFSSTHFASIYYYLTPSILQQLLSRIDSQDTLLTLPITAFLQCSPSNYVALQSDTVKSAFHQQSIASSLLCASFDQQQYDHASLIPYTNILNASSSTGGRGGASSFVHNSPLSSPCTTASSSLAASYYEMIPPPNVKYNPMMLSERTHDSVYLPLLRAPNRLSKIPPGISGVGVSTNATNHTHAPSSVAIDKTMQTRTLYDLTIGAATSAHKTYNALFSPSAEYLSTTSHSPLLYDVIHAVSLTSCHVVALKSLLNVAHLHHHVLGQLWVPILHTLTRAYTVITVLNTPLTVPKSIAGSIMDLPRLTPSWVVAELGAVLLAMTSLIQNVTKQHVQTAQQGMNASKGRIYSIQTQHIQALKLAKLKTLRAYGMQYDPFASSSSSSLKQPSPNQTDILTDFVTSTHVPSLLSNGIAFNHLFHSLLLVNEALHSHFILVVSSHSLAPALYVSSPTDDISTHSSSISGFVRGHGATKHGAGGSEHTGGGANSVTTTTAASSSETSVLTNPSALLSSTQPLSHHFLIMPSILPTASHVDVDDPFDLNTAHSHAGKTHSADGSLLNNNNHRHSPRNQTEHRSSSEQVSSQGSLANLVDRVSAFSLIFMLDLVEQTYQFAFLHPFMASVRHILFRLTYADDMMTAQIGTLLITRLLTRILQTESIVFQRHFQLDISQQIQAALVQSSSSTTTASSSTALSSLSSPSIHPIQTAAVDTYTSPYLAKTPIATTHQITTADVPQITACLEQNDFFIIKGSLERLASVLAPQVVNQQVDIIVGDNIHSSLFQTLFSAPIVSPHHELLVSDIALLGPAAYIAHSIYNVGLPKPSEITHDDALLKSSRSTSSSLSLLVPSTQHGAFRFDCSDLPNNIPNFVFGYSCSISHLFLSALVSFACVTKSISLPIPPAQSTVTSPSAAPFSPTFVTPSSHLSPVTRDDDDDDDDDDDVTNTTQRGNDDDDDVSNDNNVHDDNDGQNLAQSLSPGTDNISMALQLQPQLPVAMPSSSTQATFSVPSPGITFDLARTALLFLGALVDHSGFLLGDHWRFVLIPLSCAVHSLVMQQTYIQRCVLESLPPSLRSLVTAPSPPKGAFMEQLRQTISFNRHLHSNTHSLPSLQDGSSPRVHAFAFTTASGSTPLSSSKQLISSVSNPQVHGVYSDDDDDDSNSDDEFAFTTRTAAGQRLRLFTTNSGTFPQGQGVVVHHPPGLVPDGLQTQQSDHTSTISSNLTPRNDSSGSITPSNSTHRGSGARPSGDIIQNNLRQLTFARAMAGVQFDSNDSLSPTSGLLSGNESSSVVDTSDPLLMSQYHSLQQVTDDDIAHVPAYLLPFLIHDITSFAFQYAHINTAFVAIHQLWRIADFISELCALHHVPRIVLLKCLNTLISLHERNVYNYIVQPSHSDGQQSATRDTLWDVYAHVDYLSHPFLFFQDVSTDAIVTTGITTTAPYTMGSPSLNISASERSLHGGGASTVSTSATKSSTRSRDDAASVSNTLAARKHHFLSFTGQFPSLNEFHQNFLQIAPNHASLRHHHEEQHEQAIETIISLLGFSPSVAAASSTSSSKPSQPLESSLHSSTAAATATVASSSKTTINAYESLLQRYERKEVYAPYYDNISIVLDPFDEVLPPPRIQPSQYDHSIAFRTLLLRTIGTPGMEKIHQYHASHCDPNTTGPTPPPLAASSDPTHVSAHERALFSLTLHSLRAFVYHFTQQSLHISSDRNVPLPDDLSQAKIYSSMSATLYELRSIIVSSTALFPSSSSSAQQQQPLSPAFLQSVCTSSNLTDEQQQQQQQHQGIVLSDNAMALTDAYLQNTQRPDLVAIRTERSTVSMQSSFRGELYSRLLIYLHSNVPTRQTIKFHMQTTQAYSDVLLYYVFYHYFLLMRSNHTEIRTSSVKTFFNCFEENIPMISVYMCELIMMTLIIPYIIHITPESAVTPSGPKSPIFATTSHQSNIIDSVGTINIWKDTKSLALHGLAQTISPLMISLTQRVTASSSSSMFYHYDVSTREFYSTIRQTSSFPNFNTQPEQIYNAVILLEDYLTTPSSQQQHTLSSYNSTHNYVSSDLPSSSKPNLFPLESILQHETLPQTTHLISCASPLLYLSAQRECIPAHIYSTLSYTLLNMVHHASAELLIPIAQTMSLLFHPHILQMACADPVTTNTNSSLHRSTPPDHHIFPSSATYASPQRLLFNAMLTTTSQFCRWLQQSAQVFAFKHMHQLCSTSIRGNMVGGSANSAAASFYQELLQRFERYFYPSTLGFPFVLFTHPDMQSKRWFEMILGSHIHQDDDNNIHFSQEHAEAYFPSSQSLTQSQQQRHDPMSYQFTGQDVPLDDVESDAAHVSPVDIVYFGTQLSERCVAWCYVAYAMLRMIHNAVTLPNPANVIATVTTGSSSTQQIVSSCSWSHRAAYITIARDIISAELLLPCIPALTTFIQGTPLRQPNEPSLLQGEYLFTLRDLLMHVATTTIATHHVTNKRKVSTNQQQQSSLDQQHDTSSLPTTSSSILHAPLVTSVLEAIASHLRTAPPDQYANLGIDINPAYQSQIQNNISSSSSSSLSSKQSSAVPIASVSGSDPLHDIPTSIPTNTTPTSLTSWSSLLQRIEGNISNHSIISIPLASIYNPNHPICSAVAVSPNGTVLSQQTSVSIPEPVCTLHFGMLPNHIFQMQPASVMSTTTTGGQSAIIPCVSWFVLSSPVYIAKLLTLLHSYIVYKLPYCLSSTQITLRQLQTNASTGAAATISKSSPLSSQLQQLANQSPALTSVAHSLRDVYAPDQQQPTLDDSQYPPDPALFSVIFTYVRLFLPLYKRLLNIVFFSNLGLHTLPEVSGYEKRLAYFSAAMASDASTGHSSTDSTAGSILYLTLAQLRSSSTTINVADVSSHQNSDYVGLLTIPSLFVNLYTTLHHDENCKSILKPVPFLSSLVQPAANQPIISSLYDESLLNNNSSNNSTSMQQTGEHAQLEETSDDLTALNSEQSAMISSESQQSLNDQVSQPSLNNQEVQTPPPSPPSIVLLPTTKTNCFTVYDSLYFLPMINSMLISCETLVKMMESHSQFLFPAEPYLATVDIFSSSYPVEQSCVSLATDDDTSVQLQETLFWYESGSTVRYFVVHQPRTVSHARVGPLSHRYVVHLDIHNYFARPALFAIYHIYSRLLNVTTLPIAFFNQDQIETCLAQLDLLCDSAIFVLVKYILPLWLRSRLDIVPFLTLLSDAISSESPTTFNFDPFFLARSQTSQQQLIPSSSMSPMEPDQAPSYDTLQETITKSHSSLFHPNVSFAHIASLSQLLQSTVSLAQSATHGKTAESGTTPHVAPNTSLTALLEACAQTRLPLAYLHLLLPVIDPQHPLALFYTKIWHTRLHMMSQLACYDTRKHPRHAQTISTAQCQQVAAVASYMYLQMVKHTLNTGNHGLLPPFYKSVLQQHVSSSSPSPLEGSFQHNGSFYSMGFKPLPRPFAIELSFAIVRLSELVLSESSIASLLPPLPQSNTETNNANSFTLAHISSLHPQLCETIRQPDAELRTTLMMVLSSIYTQIPHLRF